MDIEKKITVMPRFEKNALLQEMEMKFQNDPDRYNDEKLLWRKDETTVSDLVRMVRAGQPINGIERAYPEDDDNDGVHDDRTVSDEENDRRDYEVMQKIQNARRFLDDDPVIALHQIGAIQNELRMQVQKQQEQQQEQPPQEQPPQEQQPQEQQQVQETQSNEEVTK